MEIIYHLDSINRHLFPDVKTIDDLKKKLLEMFSFKGLSPDVFVEDNFVKIIFDDKILFKVQNDYHKAVKYAEKEDFEQALKLFNFVVDKCPLHSEAYRNIAQIKMLKRDIDGAIDSLIDALHVDPQNVSALILMGNIFAREKNDIDTANNYYEKVLELDPKNNIAINNIAGNLLNAGKLDEGERFLKEAYDIDPTYPNTIYGLAMIARRRKDYENAFMYAMDAAKLPKSVENPELRTEILKLLLIAANEYAENFDTETYIKNVVKRMEEKSGQQIRIEPDSSLSTLAKLEYSKAHNVPYNLIKYKNGSSNVMHHVLHELMHLDLIVEAERQNRNVYVISKDYHFSSFKNRFLVDFKKKISIDQALL
jgi:tetratricopeptide (TPR) repeat protein